MKWSSTRVCYKWTLVLVVVLILPCVYSRPQDSSTPVVTTTSSSVQSNDTRRSSQLPIEEINKTAVTSLAAPDVVSSARDVKTKAPAIGDSIKLVTNQLLDKNSSKSADAPIVIDTRVPPKLKNKLSHKHKIKTREENTEEPVENSHAGIAEPVSIDETETETINESSTTNEGISTWVLVNSPNNKDNETTSTEATKSIESQKKPLKTSANNKNKKPLTTKNNSTKNHSENTNKTGIVSISVPINENKPPKVNDTNITNTKKTKISTTPRTTVINNAKGSLATETTTIKKKMTTKATATEEPLVKVTSKPKKKNKNKNKVSSTTLPSVVSESALLPLEAKEQEIEIEVSTPASTVKKNKRTSSRKKNKTKKRKTSTPKPAKVTSVGEVKVSNKTKKHKHSNKQNTTAITTQLYNYLSREVMPSVGVGVIGLAGLVGLASYFFYPSFVSPVRRTFEVDKKDDLYRHNAEEYANEGNGQLEEEMLGTVLAGMPTHTKNKFNPYGGQTVQSNRYSTKKDQDLRYRHVTTKYEPNYNVRYPQQKTGIAHAAVYPVKYNQQYETRHAYTTESKYGYDKANGYTPYPAVEPIYAAPQTGPEDISYGNDASNSVVYGVKPSSGSDFRPVYPFEGHNMYDSDTTNNPVTYPSTSLYLGSNDEVEEQNESKYNDDADTNNGKTDNKFVVGNVPKEISESATPAVVPEHGPRKLNRKKRNAKSKRSITGSIEELLKVTKEKNRDIFMSNEIDEALGVQDLASEAEYKLPISSPKEIYTVYAETLDSKKDTTDSSINMKTEIVESVSTLPFDNTNQKTTTESDLLNEIETTAKTFRVYEILTTQIPIDMKEKSSPLIVNPETEESTTQAKNLNTETTTEFKSDTTSTMPPTPSAVTDPKENDTVTPKPKPTYYPEVITYPPLNQEGGFFTFLKRLVEFKYRLGLSLLQSTSERLNRYLRNLDDTMQRVAKASKANSANRIEEPTEDVKDAAPTRNESFNQINIASKDKILETKNKNDPLNVTNEISQQQVGTEKISVIHETELNEKIKLNDVKFYNSSFEYVANIDFTQTNPSSQVNHKESNISKGIQEKKTTAAGSNGKTVHKNKTKVSKHPVRTKSKPDELKKDNKNKENLVKKGQKIKMTSIILPENTITTTVSGIEETVEENDVMLKKNHKNKLKATPLRTMVPNMSTVEPAKLKKPEIVIKISTPAPKTKKVKHKSNKTKKVNTSSPKPKNKISPAQTTAVTLNSGMTSHFYNLLVREIMPTVGVGVIGLAGLVGLAGYFLYPTFTTPVRRTFEINKKENLYKHNAENYADDLHGQPEEEMFGTVLAGMPDYENHKRNPYIGHAPQKTKLIVSKNQDSKFKYEPSNNIAKIQQKTGLVHEPYPHYNKPHYILSKAYTTEKNYDKLHMYSITPSPVFEYTKSVSQPSYLMSFEKDGLYHQKDTTNFIGSDSISWDTDFRPVYFNGQTFQDPITNQFAYPLPTKYLESTEESDEQEYKVSSNRFKISNRLKPNYIEYGPRDVIRKRNNLIGAFTN